MLTKTIRNEIFVHHKKFPLQIAFYYLYMYIHDVIYSFISWHTICSILMYIYIYTGYAIYNKCIYLYSISTICVFFVKATQ